MPSRFARQMKVRPDFRLDQHDGLGIDRRQRAVDEFAAVNRIINFADVRGQPAAQLGHAGGRGGGHDDFEVRHARFERADELRAEIDLADADGVQPDDVAVGQRLFEAGVVFAQTAGRNPAASCRAAASARNNTATTGRKK